MDPKATRDTPLPLLNVLITSLSHKVPLVQAVQASLQRMGQSGQVIGADANPNCIGRYFTNAFWAMPPLDMLRSAELLRFCHEHQVHAIIPTRDGELAFFAEQAPLLAEQNIHVMVSSPEAVAVCLDKLRFAERLTAFGFPVIPTASTMEAVKSNALVVKERYGAGSRQLSLNLTREQAQAQSATLTHPIFQPFIRGREWSVDLYVTRQGRVKGAIARRRLLVVHGESQVTVTQRYPALETLCGQMAQALDLYGHVLFQVLETDDPAQPFHVIECNPRFGGASTLSLAAGLESFTWFFQGCLGKNVDDIPFQRASGEKRLIRYATDRILDDDSRL